MCLTTDPKFAPSMIDEAARNLAKILSPASLGGYGIDPDTLRAIIQGKWSSITLYAHAIHGSDPKPDEARADAKEKR